MRWLPLLTFSKKQLLFVGCIMGWLLLVSVSKKQAIYSLQG